MILTLFNLAYQASIYQSKNYPLGIESTLFTKISPEKKKKQFQKYIKQRLIFIPSADSLEC